MKKAVIVISSHVVRGSVGNRAAVFALEALGHPVWALQTITLPWHPGHGPSTRIVPDEKQFAAVIDDLCNAPWLSEVGGIVSGYLGHFSQSKSIAKLVAAVKQASPNALYLCDPVIGDAGGLYVPEETALAIKQDLLPIADIITPNRFELAWISQKAINSNDDILSALAQMASTRAFVTSAFAHIEGNIGNLFFHKDECKLAEHPSFQKPINGPGDLTSAILMAHLMLDHDLAHTLQSVTSSVYEVLMRTIQAGENELMLEQNMSSLRKPQTHIELTNLYVAGF